MAGPGNVTIEERSLERRKRMVANVATSFDHPRHQEDARILERVRERRRR